jgi:hypothetical protein
MKTCKIIECNNNIWSNGFCKNHISRKPLPSGRGLTSRMNGKSFTKAPQKDNERVIIQREFFLSIWKKRPHRSEISNVYLGNEAMSTYFHHILPKEKYPEACLDEENIILLSLLEHSNVENDMYRYEEINERRNQLKLKYNIL